MVKYDEIMRMLDAGMDPDEIANDFAKALNSAIESKKEAKKLQEERKKKDTEDLVNVWNGYMEKYYPSVVTEKSLTVTDFTKLMDNIISLQNSLRALVEECGEPDEEIDEDAVLEKFFGAFGIK